MHGHLVLNPPIQGGPLYPQSPLVSNLQAPQVPTAKKNISVVKRGQGMQMIAGSAAAIRREKPGFVNAPSITGRLCFRENGRASHLLVIQLPPEK
ncbi:MAG: hypothetical protein CM15mP68_2120 [Pseudomonadota bacterium]|nr:MAG: hypothetical protein CM15mP68_2120 [Pseudomonadota bacterium]